MVVGEKVLQQPVEGRGSPPNRNDGRRCMSEIFLGMAKNTNQIMSPYPLSVRLT